MAEILATHPRILAEAEARSRNARRLGEVLKKNHKRIEAALIAMQRENFQKGEAREGEPWQELSDTTKERRRKGTGGGSIKPLVDTGRMMGAAGAKSLFIGAVLTSGVNYAKIHQTGFSGVISQRIAEHTRKAHSRTRKGKQHRVRAHSVSGHTRRVRLTIPRRPQKFRKATVLRILRWIKTDMATGARPGPKAVS